MALRLHPPEALLEAVLNASKRDRRIAFVLGSAMSSPAVPDSAGVVDLVRAAVSPYPTIARALETALAQASWGTEYAVAMALLRERSGPQDVEKVIRQAVRQARHPDAATYPDDQVLELDLEGWKVPRGPAALGRLLAQGSGGLGGPVLSLAWDPLLAVAIRRAGGRVVQRVLDSDGNLHRPNPGRGGVELVHLHGAWRSPRTLHAGPTRRRLAEGLAPLLRDHTVIVLGVGARDDVVLQALVDIAREDDAQVTLSWAFHEADRVQVKTDAGKLLARTEPLQRTGRFRTYGGVDAHAWCVALEKAMEPEVQPEPVAPEVRPEPPPPPTLPGWTAVDGDLLDEAVTPGPDHAAFAAGQDANWGVVGSGRLAERDRVKEIQAAIVNQHERRHRWSVHLLLGPDGEGKSTVLRQVAAHFARKGGPWRVWWRDHGGLRWDQVGPSAERGTGLVLVSDNADELLRRHDLAAFLDQKKLPGRLKRCGAEVHLVLAATAKDWRRASRTRPKWLKAQGVVVHRTLHGLNAREARRFVLAAEALDLQGELAGLPDLDARAAHLAALSEKRSDASLLGALLQGRTGQALEDHVAAWLTGLRGKRSTRFPPGLRAWLHVAAIHVTGLGALDRRVLRAALDVDDSGLDTIVANSEGWLVPFAQGRFRGVAVGSPTMAQVSLALLDGLTLGLTRAQLYADLATATITGVPGYARERRIEAIPQLAERLWRAGDRDAGAAMAAAAHTAAPQHSGFVRSHVRILRESGQPAAARKVCAAWAEGIRKQDPKAPLDRVVLQEWTASVRADVADSDHTVWGAWIALLAVSDQAGGKVRAEAARSVLGVADALAEMDPEGTEPRAVQGRAAAVVVLQHAPKGSLGPRDHGARDRHRAAVGDLWKHLSRGAVSACLSGVTRLAWEQTSPTTRIEALSPDGRLTFQGLVEIL